MARERQRAPRRRLRASWLAVALVLAAAIGGLSYLRVWPPLATVMSASMSPTIKTGDIVVLKKLGGPARIGDIVAISVPEDIRTRYGYPPVIIHRIVEIDADDVVTTKGDAYKDPDPFEVPRSALTTKVVATVPAAGRVLAFLGSGLGLLWLAGGALGFLVMPLVERYRDGQRRQAGNQEHLQVTLQAVSEELASLRAAPVEQPAETVAAELKAIAATLAERDAAAAEERRASAAAAERREAELQAAIAAAAEREAALAAELRRMAEDAQRREQALAAELRTVTVSLTKAVEGAERRATTAEEQLHAHLEALPAQIERAVALALASHTPPPAPPPPPTRRFVPASQWSGRATWDAPTVLA